MKDDEDKAIKNILLLNRMLNVANTIEYKFKYN